MISIRTTRDRSTAPIAALLLVLQALAAVAVPLAHAIERETAPAAVEAHHDATCVVIHDALRCALCIYAGSLTTPPSPTPHGAHVAVAARRARSEAAAVAASPRRTGSQPRAPPLYLS